MVIGDVGYGSREELDLIPSGTSGQNFGWPCFEGTAPFDGTAACVDPVAPILDLPHGPGDCSIIAGVVVHDPRLPALAGRFLFGDYCTGVVEADQIEGGQVVDRDSLGVIVPANLEGISFHHPDRTPPRVRIVAAPPPVTGNAAPSFVVTAGDVDSGTRDLRVAYQFDSRARTPFATDVNAISPGLPLGDGDHVLRVWAKDRALNESAEPFEVTFTVDATAPRPTRPRS